MHNLLYRSNALFTVSTTVLGAMCLLTALTDLTHRPAVRLEGSLRSVDGLQARVGGLPRCQGHPAILVSQGADVLAGWRSGSTATTAPGCRSNWTWTWATCSPGTPSRRAPPAALLLVPSEPAQPVALCAAVVDISWEAVALVRLGLTPSRPPRCLCMRWRSGRRPPTT